jgi:hypothetical protein
MVGDDVAEVGELPPAEPVCLGEAVQDKAGKVEEIGLGRDGVEARRPFLGDKGPVPLGPRACCADVDSWGTAAEMELEAMWC